MYKMYLSDLRIYIFCQLFRIYVVNIYVLINGLSLNV